MKTFGYVHLAPEGRSVYGIFSKKSIILDAEPHIMATARKLFGDHAKNQYNSGKLTHKPLGFALNNANAKDLLWFGERYPLEFDEELKDRLLAMEAEYDAMVAAVENSADDPTFTVNPESLIMQVPPREHQVKFRNMVRKVKRVLNADVMGMGKTISALACITEPSQRPALVVCPPHLCLQWEKELKRVFPDLTSHIIKGFKNYPLPNVEVLITSYNRLTYWQDVLVPLPIQTLILDEVHELRSTSTAKRDTSVSLSMKTPNVIGLSGTPIFNYGIEIWSVIDAIKPGSLGDGWDFAGEWCVGDSVREPAVLNSYLKSQGLMIRRTPEDVGLSFGNASKHFYTLDTDLKSLEAMQNTMRALALSVLSAPLNESDAFEKDFDWKLRKATGVAKAKAVAAFVTMMVSQGEKVVLAGWHRDVYDIWLKELAQFNPVMFTGTESPKEKNEAVRAFTEDDKCMVFIISMGSGAGLDGLQHVSRNMVFGELDWSPHRMDQVMMRVDRDGQTKHPQGFYLAIADGSDPFIMNILQSKRSQSDGIVDGKQSEATILDGKDKEEEKLRIREMAKAYLKSLGEEIPETVEETGLLKDVSDALRSIKVPTNSEEEMQEALWKVLPGMIPHAQVDREVKVGKKSRLDFMVSYGGVKIAIELKATAQDRAAVYRQVRRYVKEAGVNAVVLFAPWFGIGSFVVDTTPVVVVDSTKAAI